MWVDQGQDAVVASSTSADEEYAHSTDERIDIASSRPPIPNVNYRGQRDRVKIIYDIGSNLTGDLDQGHG